MCFKLKGGEMRLGGDFNIIKLTLKVTLHRKCLGESDSRKTKEKRMSDDYN